MSSIHHESHRFDPTGARNCYLAGVGLAMCIGLMFAVGCGSGATTDQMIDPLNLIEDYDPATPRHHPVNLSEVDLGEYYVTIPIENSYDMLSVRFRVHAVVPKTKIEAINQSVEEKRNRVKDELMTVVQGIDYQELSDPAMTWLKAEMIPVLNRELRSEDIRDVVFSDFTSERG